MDVLGIFGALHQARKMLGFSLWPTTGGYQASLRVDANTFRIRVGATPEEAIRELFSMEGPDEILPEQPMIAAREVFEPELPEPEDTIFD